MKRLCDKIKRAEILASLYFLWFNDREYLSDWTEVLDLIKQFCIFAFWSKKRFEWSFFCNEWLFLLFHCNESLWCETIYFWSQCCGHTLDIWGFSSFDITFWYNEIPKQKRCLKCNMLSMLILFYFFRNGLGFSNCIYCTSISLW